MTPQKQLKHIDVFGEWRNAHAANYAGIVRKIENLNVDRSRDESFEYSISYMRTRRPNSSDEGQKFWETNDARANLLNAFLNRGNRTIESVEEELDIGSGKSHSYLKTAAGIIFNPRPQKQSCCISLDDDHCEAEVVYQDLDNKEPAMVRPEGYPVAVEARWSPANWGYRLTKPIEGPRGVAPLLVASAATSIHPLTLSRVLSGAGIAMNGNVYFSYLAKMLPDMAWEDPIRLIMSEDPGGDSVTEKPALLESVTRLHLLSRLDDLSYVMSGGSMSVLWPVWRDSRIEKPSGGLTLHGLNVYRALEALCDALDSDFSSTSKHALSRILGHCALPENVFVLLGINGFDITADRMVYLRHMGLIDKQGLTSKGQKTLNAFMQLAKALNSWL
jgi:hypothetical protein